MSEARNVLEESETGREIARRYRARGFSEGIGQAVGQTFARAFAVQIEEAFADGRADSMRILLEAAFGEVDDLDDLARRLAKADHKGNISRIVAGATIDDLRVIP
jgi:hypothetical protein